MTSENAWELHFLPSAFPLHPPLCIPPHSLEPNNNVRAALSGGQANLTWGGAVEIQTLASGPEKTIWDLQMASGRWEESSLGDYVLKLWGLSWSRQLERNWIRGHPAGTRCVGEPCVRAFCEDCCVEESEEGQELCLLPTQPQPQRRGVTILFVFLKENAPLKYPQADIQVLSLTTGSATLCQMTPTDSSALSLDPTGNSVRKIRGGWSSSASQTEHLPTPPEAISTPVLRTTMYSLWWQRTASWWGWEAGQIRLTAFRKS